MRTTGERFGVLLTALLALAGARAALAQEEWTTSTTQEAKVTELGTSDALVGKKIWVDAKVVVVSGSELVIRDADVLLLLDQSVISKLQSLREGDNVRAFGLLARDAAGRRSLSVKRLERRADDASLFKEELERLRASGDRAGLFALAARADQELSRTKNDPALRQMVAEIYRAAIAAEAKAVKPDDAAAAQHIADLYKEKLGDRAAALEWLKKTFERGAYPAPEINKRLTAINAVPYAGDWVLYEDMKRAEGFVQRGDSWMLAEHAAFLDAVDDQIRSPRRERLTTHPDAFVEAAKHGQVLLGMTKREVASAIGFPDDVDRIRRTVELQTRIYDAWIFDGRGLYIFENDVLFKRP